MSTLSSQYSASFDDKFLLNENSNHGTSFFNIDALAALFKHNLTQNPEQNNVWPLNLSNFEFDDESTHQMNTASNQQLQLQKQHTTHACVFNQCFMKNNLFSSNIDADTNLIHLTCSNGTCHKSFQFHQFCYQAILRENDCSSNRFNRNRSNSIEFSNRILNCPLCTIGILKFTQTPHNDEQHSLRHKANLNNNKSRSNNGKTKGSMSHNGNKNTPMPIPQQKTHNRRRTFSNSSTGSYSSSLTSSVGAQSPFINNGVSLKKLSLNKVKESNCSNSSSASDSSDSGICSTASNTHQNLSSPASSTSSSSLLYLQQADGKGWFHGIDETNASSGSTLIRRQEWSMLGELPMYKQNSYHIRLEDDGPFGNDDVRAKVLSQFGLLGIKEVKCVVCTVFGLCSKPLQIYDRFPLLDGTLFQSPLNYYYYYSNLVDSIRINMNGNEKYVYAVCVKCINHWSNVNNSTQIKCKHCATKWKSESIQIGTLYKYDLLAAYPCCNARLTCNKCKTQLCDLDTNPLPYFSSYSEEIECFNCKSKDYHFIKQILKSFIRM